jgi:DNA polymerase sigma
MLRQNGLGVRSRDKAYVLGAKPKADMAQLDAELVELVQRLRPTEEEKKRQNDALEAVRAALTQRWPDCKVHLFGSTANHLSICNNNDIDVCLELPDLPNDPVTPPPQIVAVLHTFSAS